MRQSEQIIPIQCCDKIIWLHGQQKEAIKHSTAFSAQILDQFTTEKRRPIKLPVTSNTLELLLKASYLFAHEPEAFQEHLASLPKETTISLIDAAVGIFLPFDFIQALHQHVEHLSSASSMMKKRKKSDQQCPLRKSKRRKLTLDQIALLQKNSLTIAAMLAEANDDLLHSSPTIIDKNNVARIIQFYQGKQLDTIAQLPYPDIISLTQDVDYLFCPQMLAFLKDICAQYLITEDAIKHFLYGNRDKSYNLSDNTQNLIARQMLALCPDIMQKLYTATPLLCKAITGNHNILSINTSLENTMVLGVINDSPLGAIQIFRNNYYKTYKDYTIPLKTAISNDGSTIAFIANQKIFAHYVNDDTNPLAILDNGDYNHIALNHDGTQLALNNFNNISIDLFDIEGTFIHSLQGHCNAIRQLMFKNNILVAADDTNTIYLWDCINKQCLQKLSIPDHIERLDVSNDATTIAYSSHNTIGIVDTKTASIKNIYIPDPDLFITLHKQPIYNAIALHPDGKLLAFTNATTLFLWDIATDTCIKQFDHHTYWPELRINNTSLICTSIDGKIISYDILPLLKTMQFLHNINIRQAHLLIAYSKHGDQITDYRLCKIPEHIKHIIMQIWPTKE